MKNGELQMYNQNRVMIPAVLVQNGQKEQVNLSMENGGVSFGQTYHQYSDLKFEIGGSNDSLLFIHLPNNLSLYIELSFENKKLLQQIESQQDIFRDLFKKKRSTYKFDIIVLGAFLAIVSLVIYFRGPLFSSVSALFPQSLERKIGNKIFQKDSKDTFLAQQEAEKKLYDLVKNIKSFDESQYTIHLSSKSELNAYATLGGHIFVNVGLIKKLKTPEQLLGVVAHEMVHARNRHVVKNLFQSAGVFIFFQALLGDISGVAAVLIDGGAPLLNLSYSRDLETEADIQSVSILNDSDIDPSGLIAALEIIEVESKKLAAEMPGADILAKIEKHNFLRSHPVTLDRNAEIKKEIDKQSKNLKYKDLSQLWLNLQKSVSNL